MLQRQNDRGFTLIEILIVILIIGIMASVTLFAYGDFGASRKADTTAEQFIAYIKLVQQRSILEMVSLGVTVTSQGYETYRFDNNQWQLIPRNSHIFRRSFPEGLVVNLKSNIKHGTKAPTIIITPAGKMTEFILTFGTSSQPEVNSVVGLYNGDLKLIKTQHQ